MDFLQAVFIGIVHGITVFLPVSSSGHTSLIGSLWNINGAEGLFFEVLLHVAALIAVLFAFWKDVTKIAAEIILICMDVITNIEIFIENKRSGADKRYQKISGTNYRKLTLLLIVSAVPMAIIGFLSRRLVEIAFGSLLPLAVGMMISVILLLVMDYIAKGDKIPKDMTYDNAIWLGICQGISVFPGISRTGICLSVCLLCGLNRKVAVKFTFLMSIPAICGALILEMGHLGDLAMTGRMFASYFCGALAAGITGFFLIRYLSKYLQIARFRGFAAYSFLLGVAAIVYNFLR